MVLPIVAYGDPVLKRRAAPVDVADPALTALVENLFETMYNAKGVGLAAPQVGLSVRLFVVDGSPFAEDAENAAQEEVIKAFKRAFFNPEVLEESGELWGFEEGCLSIPGIRGEVFRPEYVKIHYWTEHGDEKEEVFEGFAARIIQHEYDHIEGILFTDHLNVVKKRLIKNKLTDITRGKVSVDYKMKLAR